jgi:diguanylate cyclase (GGDEF)-like protein/PAS domain S-box-containing protein
VTDGVTSGEGHGIEELLGAGVEPAQLLLGSMPDVAIVLDRDGRILYTNREAPGQPLVGTSVFEHNLGAEAEARMRAAMHQVFNAGKPMSYEVESTEGEGETAWYVSRWSPIEREGEIVAALVVASDITRPMMLERLDLAEQETILDSAADGILRLDEAGSVGFANTAAHDLLGASEGELRGRSIHELVHGGDSGPHAHDADECPVLLAVTHGVVQHMEDDVFWRADGSSFPVNYTSSPVMEGEELRGAVLTFNDVTERKRFEAQLQYLADHDPITGLYNRRRFEQELARHLAYDARYGTGGAVLVLDIDNFKDINDTLGHKAGDEVITRVARTIRERIRETDTFARLGGDEFVILLPEAGIEQAQSVARTIVDTVRMHPISVAGQQIQVTTSIGVTTFGNREVDGDALLVEADLAMYDAKAAGRDRFALYTPATVRQAEIESRLAWVGRVRHALDEQLFVMYCQPIVSIATGEPVQHELLLRMVGDDGKLILPGSFIPTAERFGLMPAVDRWVIDQAVRLLAHTEPEVRLSVNVSGGSLGNEELTRLLAADLAETGVDPSRLVLEVIEQTAVANLEETRRFAQEVHHLGCQFALDDFGAGFGSFYYLKYMPFDYLKIDGDFIHSLPASRTDQLVVQAVADIAHGLEKETIAEYVGDADTLALLDACGVDMAQGHYIGRPVPADNLVA